MAHERDVAAWANECILTPEELTDWVEQNGHLAQSFEKLKKFEQADEPESMVANTEKDERLKSNWPCTCVVCYEVSILVNCLFSGKC